VTDLLPVTDLWLCPEPVSLDPDLADAFADMLNETEQLRWQRFKYPQDRDRFLLVRALVRSVLGTCLDIPPAQVRFRANAWGKPELDTGVHDGSSLQFNLSHTRGLAVLALAEGVPLGVDVEDLHRRVEWLALAQRYFARDEVADLQALPPAAQRGHFFSLWTLKEAYVKALGLGLRIPLADFSFSLSADKEPLLHHPDSFLSPKHWQFDSMQVEEHFRLALAVQGGASGPRAIRLHKGLPLQGYTLVE